MNHDRSVRRAIATAVIAFLVMLIFAFLGICDVWGDSDSIKTETEDTYMRDTSSVDYATVHASSKATEYYNTTVAISRIGQILAGAKFYVERTYLMFDTDDLSNYKTIDSAFVWMYLDDDWSATDFNITLTKGLWSSDPPDSSDFEIGVGWDSTTAGNSQTTNGICSPDCWFSVELDSVGWIDTNGVTRITVVSSRDIGADEPSGDEHIEIYSGNSSGKEPALQVFYTTACPETVHIEQEKTPQYVNDSRPEFKAFCSDPDSCYEIRWIVGSTVGGTDIWNGSMSNIADVDSGEWTQELTPPSALSLTRSTWYYVQCMTQDKDGNNSAWSDVDSFRNVAGCTVYVNLTVDTESGDANMDDLNDNTPEIYFDTWHITNGESPDTGGAWLTTQTDWRDNLLDSNDSLPRFNWNIILGDAVCSSSNSWSDKWEGCRCIGDTAYQTLYQVWVDSGFQDRFGIHYTHFDRFGGGWSFGGHDDYDTAQAEILMAQLIGNNNYPYVYAHRAGWNKGNCHMNIWLSHWVIFDYSNVHATQGHVDWALGEAMWRTYHPDSSVAGDSSGCPAEIGDLSNRIGQAGHIDTMSVEIATVFDSAASYGYAVAGCYMHTFDEYEGRMTDHVETFYDACTAQVNLKNIPFVWCNQTECERWSRGWTDQTAPTITFSAAGSDSVDVTVNGGDMYMAEPFGFEWYGDSAVLITYRNVDSDTWRYDSTVFDDTCIFVVSDTCNNVVMDTLLPAVPSEGIRRRKILLRGDNEETTNSSVLFAGNIFSTLGQCNKANRLCYLPYLYSIP